MNDGYQLIKEAKAQNLSFHIFYETDDADDARDPDIGYTPAHSLDSTLAELWDEATACDSTNVRFADGSWVYFVHGNGPDETISDHSISGTAGTLCNLVFEGVRA